MEESAKLNSGHRARLRSRFLRAGLDGLGDYEAVELLLTYAIPRRDVKPLAKRLLARYGSLGALFDARPADLLDEFGMGASAVTLLVLLRELCSEYLKQKMRDCDLLDSAQKVTDFLRMKLGGGRKETFAVLFLDSHNRFLEMITFPGTVDKAVVYNREVVEKAALIGATRIIAAHNHPSGVCTPSARDIAVTNDLRRALENIGVVLLDHFIVTPTAAASLKALKLI